MFRYLGCCGAIALTACTPVMNNDVRTVARNAAEQRFAPECGNIDIPARAFLPIDITGDNRDDYVLSFARVECRKSANPWTGSGGPLFQLWTNDGGKPRMVLEENMHAFQHAMKSRYLMTDQRSANCPGGAGPQICRVVYRWDGTAHELRVVMRQFIPAEPLLEAGDISTWVRPSTQGKASPTAATTIYRSLSLRTDPHTHN